MLGEIIALALTAGLTAAAVLLFEWCRRGWREIAPEPRQAWGDQPYIPEEMRRAAYFDAGEGTDKAARAHIQTRQGSHSSDGEPTKR